MTLAIGLGLGICNGERSVEPTVFFSEQIVEVAAYTTCDGARVNYFLGKYWRTGGWAAHPNEWSATHRTTNEVWSSPDLITWTKELAHVDSPPASGAGARWTPRHLHMTWVHAGYLWVAGGDEYSPGGSAPNPDIFSIVPSDVWRSADGVIWERVAASCNWGHGNGVYHAIPGYYAGQMYIIGGLRPEFADQARTDWGCVAAEVYRSTDGVTWDQLADAPFARARVSDAVNVAGKMVIAGGYSGGGGGGTPVTVHSDVWSFDGTSWTQEAANSGGAWTARYWVATAAYAGKLWVTTGWTGAANAGGAYWSDDLGDTWNSVSVDWAASHADALVVTGAGIVMASGNQQAKSVYKVSPSPADGTVRENLSLTGLWKTGGFAAGTWTASASRGGSGSRNLTEATNPPTASSGAPNFDGTNDILNGTTLATFVGRRFSGWWVFTADTAPADPGAAAPYNAPGVSESVGSSLAVGITTTGVRAGYYDGVNWSSTKVAAPVASKHIACFRSNGANFELSIDGGAWSTIARAAMTPAGNLRLARPFGAVYFDGVMHEVALANWYLPDETFDEVIADLAADHGVTIP